MAAPRHGLLKHLAWWNVGLHLLALVLTWFFIRPGTEAFEYQVRCAYIAQSWLWSASWTVWMICALMQVAFYARLIGYLPKRRDTAMFALSLACVGVGIDLLCDVIWISILPVIAGVRADLQPIMHWNSWPRRVDSLSPTAFTHSRFFYLHSVCDVRIMCKRTHYASAMPSRLSDFYFRWPD
jgi:hypothetical protein